MKNILYKIGLSIIMLSLLLLLVVGYPLLLMWIFYNDIYINILTYLVSVFTTPTNDWGNFLPILITFYVGILSFMIPISIQMISTIRKDFPTEQIEKRFKDEMTFKYLPILLVFQIFGIGIFEIFGENSNEPTDFYILPIIIFLLFLTSFLVVIHIKKMIDYTDKRQVINWLLQDTKEYIHKLNNVEMSKISIRSLFDILTKEINQTPNYDLITTTMSKIEVLSLEFIPLQTDISKDANDDSFEYFKEISSGIERISNKSISIDNQDILFEIKVLIHNIIKQIIIDRNNYRYLDNFFKHHKNIMIYSIEKNHSSKYSFTYHWYSNYIFNWLDNKSYFNPEYLQVFDKTQFYYIQYVINQNQKDIFEEYISWLHGGIGFPDNNYSDLYEYFGYDFEDYEALNSLDNSFNNIKTIQNLDSFLIDFNKQKERFISKFEAKEDIDKKENQANKIIVNSHSKFFFQNLLSMVMGILTFCLYKQRYDYIKFIWEYKSPKDSDIMWMGHEIYPKTINELISIFLNEAHSFNKKFSFTEHHHSSSYYENRLVLYLIGYILYNDKNYNKNTKYLLSAETEQSVNRLKFYIEKLIKIVDDVYAIEYLQIFNDLGFEKIEKRDIHILKDTITNLFNNILIECADSIKKKEETTPLSDIKIDAFKNELYKNIETSKYKIRNLTKIGFGNYELNNSNQSIKSLGLNTLLPRSIFFDKWTGGFVGFESGISKSIIDGENFSILTSIIDNCKVIKSDEFNSILDNFENTNDIFILSVNKHKFFRNNKFFKNSRRNDIEPMIDDDGEKMSSFMGYLEFNNIDIPIFRYHDNSRDEKIIILNKTKFFTFIHMKPDYENNIMNELLYVSIQELTEDQINKIVERDIKKDTEKSTIISDLKTKVNLQVYERFEIKLDENFEGFMFLADKKEVLEDK